MTASAVCCSDSVWVSIKTAPISPVCKKAAFVSQGIDGRNFSVSDLENTAVDWSNGASVDDFTADTNTYYWVKLK